MRKEEINNDFIKSLKENSDEYLTKTLVVKVKKILKDKTVIINNKEVNLKKNQYIVLFPDDTIKILNKEQLDEGFFICQ